MKGTFPVNKFRELETPFYYYDVNVLRETLSCINKEAGPRGACRHAGRKPLLQVHVRNRIYGAAVYGQ